MLPTSNRTSLESEPLPGILHFRKARVSVFQEGEEFFIMLYSFGFVAFLMDVQFIPTQEDSSSAVDP